MFITEDELYKVRKSIVPEKKIIKKGEILPIDKNSINCYAYALGIMESAKGNGWYEPGFTANNLYLNNKQDFIQKIKKDLENLGFIYRYIPLDGSKELYSDEYLIKIFLGEEDFHFIRKSTKNGRWFHKVGWCSQPEYCKTDTSQLNPYDKYYKRYCLPGYLEPTGFIEEDDNSEVKPLGYFAISLKK